jgi:hypothetical protein
VDEEHREGLHIFVVFMFGFMNKEIFFNLVLMLRSLVGHNCRYVKST